MLHMPTFFRSLLVSTVLRDQGFVPLSSASFRWAPSKQEVGWVPQFNPSKGRSIKLKTVPACGITQLSPLTSMGFQGSSQDLSKVEDFDFGPYKIHPSEVFLTTRHSFAFVNLRPVVPGHVLVSSKRVVARFSDLAPDEVCDMWLTANRVGVKLEAYFNASSLTFAIQDGPAAGQTVPHVHIHILPRRSGDFEKNDEIYDVINDKEKELAEHMNLDKERVDRASEEMVAEASALRALFSD